MLSLVGWLNVIGCALKTAAGIAPDDVDVSYSVIRNVLVIVNETPSLVYGPGHFRKISGELTKRQRFSEPLMLTM